MIHLYWHQQVRKRTIHGDGRGQRGDQRFTAWLAEIYPRDSGHRRQRYVAHLGSFLMQSDGTIVDGETFLTKAMARLDELGDILTSVEKTD